MKQKHLYSIIISVLIIVLLISYIRFLLKPVKIQNPIVTNEDENLPDKTKSKQEKLKKAGSQGVGRNQITSYDLKILLKDIPCKESYLIVKYLTELTNSKWAKEDCLGKIAAQLVREGRLDLALQIANSIEDEDSYNGILAHFITTALKDMGEYDRALDIAGSIDDKFRYDKDNAYDFISFALSDAGDFKKAMDVINLIDETYDVGGFIKSSATEYAMHKSAEKDEFPEDEYNYAIGIADNTKESRNKARYVSLIAKRLYRSGIKDLALEKFQIALDIIDSMKTAADDQNRIAGKIDSYNLISRDLIDVGEKDWGIGIFEKNLEYTSSLDDDKTRESLLCKIAETLIWSKQYQWAFEIADKFDDKQNYVYIANDFAYNDQMETAEIFFKKGIELGLKGDDKQAFFDKMAQLLIGTGKFKMTPELIETFCKNMDKDRFYYQMARGYSEIGDFEKFLSTIKFIDDEDKKFTAMRIALWDLEDNKKFDDYEKLFAKMLETANSVEDKKLRNELFLELSKDLFFLPCSEQKKYYHVFATAYDEN